MSSVGRTLLGCSVCFKGFFQLDLTGITLAADAQSLMVENWLPGHDGHRMVL
jgi:hypothetical protein